MEQLSEEQERINNDVTMGIRDVSEYVSPSSFSPRHDHNNGEYTRSQRLWDWVADMHA